MKVALLISGRSSRYEVCLLPILENTNVNVDIFMSINDDPCPYYDLMQKRLSKWLKSIHFQKYQFPENFKNIHPHTPDQKPNSSREGKFPINVMSMFYNDKKSYNMASSYGDYDIYLKYRSDILSDSLPSFITTAEYKLFSAIPNCWHSDGSPVYNRKNNSFEHRIPWVCDAIAYGNKESMKSYCSTYDFINEVNQIRNGDYQISYEPCLTQNVYDKNLPVEYFKYSYLLDKNRRIFDTYNSSRLDGSLDPMDINTVLDTIHIEAFGLM